MSRDITHSIAVRPEGDHVLLEDKEIEHGRASLLRITMLDPDAAIELGDEMARLGRAMKDRRAADVKALEFAGHADPYPEAST